MLKKLCFVLLVSVSAVSARSDELESTVDLQPGWVETETYVSFATRNSLTGALDTYEFDKGTLTWTVTGDDGVVTQGPIDADKSWVPCLAGPWGLIGCGVAGGIAWVLCDSAQSAALRRAQMQCGAISPYHSWIPSDMGICGQQMRGRCRDMRVTEIEK